MRGKDILIKKNELRITVIAANFPNSEAIKRSLFDNSVDVTAGLTTNVTASTGGTERGRIFNSIPTSSATFNQPNSETTDSTKEKNDKGAEKAQPADDDDWNAIPAFLRRSKLK